MAEKGLRRQDIIRELARSTHGDLKAYVNTASKAAVQDPEFLAHLIAWNAQKGQVRDSQVAVPVVSLPYLRADKELYDNSLAHIAKLSPRDFLKAFRFSKEFKNTGTGGDFKRLVGRYLRVRENKWPWFEKTAIQHRDSMKALYALAHVKPSTPADQVLFKGNYPVGSAFHAVANLSKMTSAEAVAAIIKFKLPFLVIQGSLGDKLKDPTTLMAMIGAMSPTELVTNMNMLEKLGVNKFPETRAALQDGLQALAASKKASFKTSKAVEAVADQKTKDKLIGAQEKQLEKISVEGNWLVLGDKSGSMQSAIEVARILSGSLAKLVAGDVHLIFFNSSPQYVDASGKTFEEIKKATARVTANGYTSVGCGLQYILDKGIEVDGIAIVSDGGENTSPMFAATYKKYCDKIGKEPPVYYYRVSPAYRELEDSCKAQGIDLQIFDLQGTNIDYYAIPNLAATMRVSRYSLADEIMGTKLLTVEEVLGE